MAYNKNIKQGIYSICNTEKYLGSLASKNKTQAVYRSSWELAAFSYLDNSPSIKQWGSELIKIPYKFDMDTFNKQVHKKSVPSFRNYFIDIYFETVEGLKYIVEIKPYKETVLPNDRKKTLRYYQEMKTYIQNQNKWSYAISFAKQHNLIFQIWTEQQINHIKRFSI